jgi:hypothetical protein
LWKTGGDEMSRASVIIALCLVAALALAAACGGGEEEPTATPTATATPLATPTPEGTVATELPGGFPGDFPLYAKATVDAATIAPEGGRFLVGWRSSDSPDQVRAFYERELDKEPWQVENVVEIAEQETVVIEFARRGDGGEWGTVAIRTVQENGQYVTIALSLTVPQ